MQTDQIKTVKFGIGLAFAMAGAIVAFVGLVFLFLIGFHVLSGDHVFAGPMVYFGATSLVIGVVIASENT